MIMTMTYVFPDLHGRLDHLVAALSACGQDGIGDDDTIVFLGDYIDRGPDSAQLVKHLREFADGRDRVICLSGNHEYMMLWAIVDGDAAMQGWLVNGGVQTVQSYTDGLGEIDEAAMRSDIEWFASLPITHVDNHRVYVHAGLEGDAPLDEQALKYTHWKRYETLDGSSWSGHHVVHGHSPDRDGPKTVGNRTAMDVGAVWSGRYVVGVFDDDVAGGPVRVIEVHG
jgi:serine/threonine protein phosphatase 1